MRTTVTICALVGFLSAGWLTFTTAMDVSMSGFPDGHVTAYGEAVDTPLQIVMWAAIGLAVLFLVLVFSSKRLRTRGLGVSAALLAFVIVAMIAKAGIPWYFGTHLGLDNGVGG